MAKINAPNKIVISRTDSIGDVVLTLPMVGILKEKFPKSKIIFLGSTYTLPVVQCSEHVDEVWDWNFIQSLEDKEQIKWLTNQNIDVFIHVFPRREIARLAKQSQIPNRIGTSHRLYHILTCNKKVNFTRKNSNLHESQLNIKLLEPLGISKEYSLKELNKYVGYSKTKKLTVAEELINPNKKNIIFHPKSKGSAKEWNIKNYIKLCEDLNPDDFNIFFTGTEKEGDLFRKKIPKQNNVFDLTGKLNLDDLISFIQKADLLMAASTGPLHIAGVLNVSVIGLFSTIKPIHAGRWSPLGDKVKIIEDKKNASITQPLEIDLREVKKAIENLLKKQRAHL